MFGLVETTSKTLLNNGHIEFPLSIEVDLPVEAIRFDLDEALGANTDTPRYVMVFEVAQAKSSRRVYTVKPMVSTVFLGYRNEPFAIIDEDPISDEDFVMDLQTPQGLFGPSGQGVGEPLMFPYTFDNASVVARRAMTVHAYLIDRLERTYIPTTFDVTKKHEFAVAYGVSRYDPKRAQHIKNHDNETDVDDYEKEPEVVTLSTLLKAFAANQDRKQAYQTAAAFRDRLLQDRNRNLAEINNNTFDERPLNDPRFDSVVAIFTGKRSMGSGFYVTPTVVMTNWHVVDNHEFVELKRYDGRETYGTVLGRDARLDVALVKVQDRGRPVAFYTEKTIDVGQNVEAIGHPHRFEFSITRGVISAVRKHSSINLPKGAGDEVLYIQTDAGINPGNSGGPLFLDNRVVGMNTWGRLGMISGSLNFAVHYSELMNFMNEHLPGYAVAPGGSTDP